MEMVTMRKDPTNDEEENEEKRVLNFENERDLRDLVLLRPILNYDRGSVATTTDKWGEPPSPSSGGGLEWMDEKNWMARDKKSGECLLVRCVSE